MKTPLVDRRRAHTFSSQSVISCLILLLLSSGAFRVLHNFNSVERREESIGMDGKGSSAPEESAPAGAPSSSDPGAPSAPAQAPGASRPNIIVNFGLRNTPTSGMMATRGQARAEAVRSAGPLLSLQQTREPEPAYRSVAGPSFTGNVPSKESSEYGALEGLLHLDLPSSLEGVQRSQPIPDEDEGETVVILDGEAVQRGPGRRTKPGIVLDRPDRANVDDINPVLERLLATVVPVPGESSIAYQKRIIHRVKDALALSGKVMSYDLSKRNWFVNKVYSFYNAHKGAGPSNQK